MDLAIAALAGKHHNVVALAELVDLGLGERSVRERVATGRLHRLHRGVYVVGTPRLTREGHLIAAVKACGPAAVVSHRSAAALWRILSDARAVIDVTASGRRGRSVSGIRAHADHLAPADRTDLDGIPCTSLARTLLDLAGEVSERRLGDAFRQAERNEDLDLRALRAAISRVSRPRGVVRLRRVIAEFDPDTLRAETLIEVRFLELWSRTGLPKPDVNATLTLIVEGVAYRPDFLWRDARLIVETDGRATHSSWADIQADRRREHRLERAGWHILRCTWNDVTREPSLLMGAIRALLLRRGGLVLRPGGLANPGERRESR